MSGAVPVLLTVPLDEPFDYALPAGLVVAPGDVVEVPFGPRRMLGVVWDQPPAKRAPADRLKAIVRRLDAPPLPPALRQLIVHVATVTLAPLGNVLKLALPVPAAFEPPPPKLGVVAAGTVADGVRLTDARRRVLEAAGDGVVRSAAEVARLAGVGAGVVQGLVKAGLLKPAPLNEMAASPSFEVLPVELSAAQHEAASALRALVGGGHRIVLLEGVPGAGKTEVYLEAVAATLAAGRQVLVLLPEIALTGQLVDRLARRFGTAPALWHSGLGAAARRRTFRRIATGEERIVIGARSALFLPLAELGLIVVDEEHDASFKQEDGVPYHGRDMAIARARLESCPAILVSATPALDTAWRAGRIGTGAHRTDGEVTALALPARHGGASMPEVRLVDLKRDRPPRGEWLAPSLRDALAETLAAGEQALLFLNRRGFAPLTLCRACGERLRCPNCSAWLVRHRLRRRLICHHCGYGRAEMDHCPSCGTVDALVACGPGVERLAEEMAGLHPEARTAILTSDSPSSAEDAAALLQAMTAHRLDVLIGTQVVAKGHHFPDLTLVGVVDGDLGLSGGDLRAGERCFQLLYQVAGRAGRAERPGRVMIQTHMPDHPVMQALASGDKERFYAEELAERRAAAMPPFGQLAALVVSGRDFQEVRRLATTLARHAPDDPRIRVLGPAPAPLALLRGRHRQRLLVIAPPEIDLPAVLQPWLGAHRLPGNLRLHVDTDPYSFL